MLTGQMLRAVRAHKGITQAELAVKARVSATAIAEFETGKRDLRASTLGKLCQALGVKAHYSVDGSLFMSS